MDEVRFKSKGPIEVDQETGAITKTGDFSGTLNLLVRFISDCWWFAKTWKPIEVKFYGVVRTKFLWGMARKRRDIKKAIAERKSNSEITCGGEE